MFSLKKLGTAGQATTEYILILVVVIALFKFIGGPLVENLTSWGFKLVGPGGYYSCLMENGLLPGFRYANSSEGCSARKADALANLTNEGEGILGGEGAEKFQTAEERARKGGGKKRKKNKKRKKKKKPKKTKTPTLGSGSGGSSRRGSSRSYAGRSKKLSRHSRSSSQTENGGSSFENSEEKGEVYTTGKKRISNKQKKKRVRRRQQGYLGFEVPEEEQRPASFKEKFSSKGKGLGETKNSRIKTKKRIERKIQVEEDKPLQFGEFLKYLFIAALIIILLVVGGSQVLELKNKD